MAGRTQFSFTVPAGAGDYAPEVRYLNGPNDPAHVLGLDRFASLVLMVAALAATSAVEVDLLRPGFDPAGGDASYYLAAVSHNTVGFKGNLFSDGWVGARIRCKSGGSAGTTTIGVTWS